MPDVLAVSRRLQNALDIYNPDPHNSFTPLTLPQPSFGPAVGNGDWLRASLGMCAGFAVDMNRKSENRMFLDRKILLESNATTNNAVESKAKAGGPQNQAVDHGVKDNPDIVMNDTEDKIPMIKLPTDSENGRRNHSDQADSSVKNIQAISQVDPVGPGFREVEGLPHEFLPEVSSRPNLASISTTVTTEPMMKHPEEKALSSNSVKSAANISHGAKSTVAFGAEQVGFTTPIAGGKYESTNQAHKFKYNPRRRKVWPILSVPDPMMMPGTFTSAICHQQDFKVAPLLTLTLREATPLVEYPATQRSEILFHFEVGLDSVEALCQGLVMIDDCSYWDENSPEPQYSQGPSNEMEQYQINKGDGHEGWWVFFGVRFRQTEKDGQKGKGGGWACFGFPRDLCSRITNNTEVTTYGGGCDSGGISVPQQLAKVQRTEFRAAMGGIACMDLWPKAGEWDWEDGVWSKVRLAMAKNSLSMSFLCPAEEFVVAQTRLVGLKEARAKGLFARKDETPM